MSADERVGVGEAVRALEDAKRAIYQGAHDHAVVCISRSLAYLASRRDEAGERWSVPDGHCVVCRDDCNDAADVLFTPHGNSICRECADSVAALTARRADSGAGEPGDARAALRETIALLAEYWSQRSYPVHAEPSSPIAKWRDERLTEWRAALAAALTQGAGERAGVEARDRLVKVALTIAKRLDETEGDATRVWAYDYDELREAARALTPPAGPQGDREGA